MKKLVVLTGAGISAESGIKTFRDAGGLWEEYPVMDVASIEAWYRNPGLMIDFYNMLRKKLQAAEPNYGHKGLVELEQWYDVSVITQNIDNLHERAGSSRIVHLHGELTKVRSERNENEIYDIGYGEIHLGDQDRKGYQLRPHIVWFGEAVPNIEIASQLVMEADIFVVIGSSLNVYPAAGLISYTKAGIPVYVIDPKDVNGISYYNAVHIKTGASEGVKRLIEILRPEEND